MATGNSILARLGAALVRLVLGPDDEPLPSPPTLVAKWAREREKREKKKKIEEQLEYIRSLGRDTEYTPLPPTDRGDYPGGLLGPRAGHYPSERPPTPPNAIDFSTDYSLPPAHVDLRTHQYWQGVDGTMHETGTVNYHPAPLYPAAPRGFRVGDRVRYRAAPDVYWIAVIVSMEGHAPRPILAEFDSDYFVRTVKRYWMRPDELELL